MKKCSECKEEKSLEDYHLNRKRKDGRAAKCRDCLSKLNKEKYHRDKNRLCAKCGVAFKGVNLQNKCNICRGDKKCQDCGKGISYNSETLRCLDCYRLFACRENSPLFKGDEKIRDGYRLIWAPENERKNKRGYALEHLVVMEKSLGRAVSVFETVHHKNGDRLDNRLENLELWSSRHPKGQRVRDLILYAKEILNEYGENEDEY